MTFPLKIAAAISASTLVLAACQPPLGNSLAPTEPLDIERMLALLPEEIVGSYETSEFDAATGANTLTNFRLTSADNPEVGVGVLELVIWGFRPEILEDRLEGTNFDESGRLLDRMEARQLSLFGVETLYEGFTNAYVDVIEDVADGLGDDELSVEIEDTFEDAFNFETFDMRAELVSVSALDIRPFERAPRQDLAGGSGDAGDGYSEDIDVTADSFAHLLETFKDVAAFNRAIGAEEMVLEGLVYDFAMEADGETVELDMAIPLTRIEGWAGGDYDRVVSEGASFAMSVPADPDGESDIALETIDISGSFGSYIVENMQLDRVYRYLAMGEMPPRTETDLMSLGTWTVENMQYSMFGSDFYSVDKSVTDLSGFHWLIPTDVTLDIDKLSYNFAGLFQSLAAADPTFSEDEDLEAFMAVLPVLDEYGLAAPSIDVDMSWLWDAEEGPGDLMLACGLEGYGTMAMDVSGLLPAFDGAADQLEAQGFDALEALFSQDTALTGASLTLADSGGIDKLFALAIDVAKVLPDTGGPDISNMTPEGLKGLAIGGISFGSSQAAQVFPPAADYAASLVQYIQTGGNFSVSLSPERPLEAKDFAKMSALVEDPDALVNLLGLNVVHEAPPAAD
ncbi:MAG: hypothetical protein AAFS13_06055 [Pseudomonadota bacterium]